MRNRERFGWWAGPLLLTVIVVGSLTGGRPTAAVLVAEGDVTSSPASDRPAGETARQRVYQNTLTKLVSPEPLLGDYPEFIQPVVETNRYEAPLLVDDENADLSVRAWRFSYNARGIIEMPNRLRARDTAVIMVHPWGIDDGQGWTTPEPAGCADFCTVEKNHLAARHTREVIRPFINRWRDKVSLVMYSLPGSEDAIRKQLYRGYTSKPTPAEHTAGKAALDSKLKAFAYTGKPLVDAFPLSAETPVIDYFRHFPGLDAGPRYNNAGFWDLPIPVTVDVDYHPDDVVIYDALGYPPLRDFLKANRIRHVLLVGYATDMCFCRTTAGFENLSKDFNVFLVGDATLATFPANNTPRYATNAHISFAALNQLVTQISWIRPLK